MTRKNDSPVSCSTVAELVSPSPQSIDTPASALSVARYSSAGGQDTSCVRLTVPWGCRDNVPYTLAVVLVVAVTSLSGSSSPLSWRTVTVTRYDPGAA